MTSEDTNGGPWKYTPNLPRPKKPSIWSQLSARPSLSKCPSQTLSTKLSSLTSFSLEKASSDLTPSHSVPNLPEFTNLCSVHFDPRDPLDQSPSCMKSLESFGTNSIYKLMKLLLSGLEPSSASLERASSIPLSLRTRRVETSKLDISCLILTISIFFRRLLWFRPMMWPLCKSGTIPLILKLLRYRKILLTLLMHLFRAVKLCLRLMKSVNGHSWHSAKAFLQPNSMSRLLVDSSIEMHLPC